MGCYGCMKCMLAFINIITILAGVLLTGTGILLIVKGHDYFPEINKYSNHLDPYGGGCIGLGILLLGIGSFGCFGAVTGRSGFLNCYFFLILGIVVVETAVVVYGMVMKKSIMEGMLDKIEVIFERVNNGTASDLELAAVSTVQITFKCCGFVNGPFYWNLWDMENKVPASCCGSRASQYSVAYYCLRHDPSIRSDPCQPTLDTFSVVFFWAVQGTLIGIVLVNLYSMIAAKRLRRSDRDDDYVYTRYNEDETVSSVHTAKSSGFNSTWL